MTAPASGSAAAPSIGRHQLRLAIAAVLSGAAALHSPLAVAGSGSATATASEGLEEIVVTARKRAENLQDVPVSIDVYSKKDIQNLAIAQFEDYATLTPSISFISAGPGTQTFVMRGVSDGSNPNYSNSASTAFLLDDMQMNYYGSTPDLHLYDIEQIEVLNGPQGTTYGAGAMAGALRFITAKPDPKAFAAGIDFDGGKIDGGQYNNTYEAYINLPIVENRTAVRISAFNAYHGGFIDNVPTTRNWINGTTSTNAAWAGNDYNTQTVYGGRLALKQIFSEAWQATLTYSYQAQHAKGAWDEDTAKYGLRNVARFGPEWKRNYTKTLDFHLDGDVGIADLVYASTYWAEDFHQLNEYSEYMQYVHTNTLDAQGRQAFTCLTDPVSSGGTLGFSGCNVPTLYYDYYSQTDRWSNEVRLQSKSGGRVHWLAGLYWEKTRSIYGDYFHMPGLNTAGAQWNAYTTYYGQTAAPPAPDDWYSYVARTDYLQTTEFGNVTIDLTEQWNIELGTTHFHSDFSNYSFGGNWYAPQSPSTTGGSSNKWDSKVGLNFKPTEHLLLYASVAQGFRDGGVNGGLPANCLQAGAPAKFVPDTVTNFEVGWKTTTFDGKLLWNGAVYYMPWKNLQTSLYDPDICLPSSFNANIGDARVYGTESDVKFKATEHLTLEFSGSYNDSRLLSDNFYNANFTVAPGERLPYVPYFNDTWIGRYDRPLGDLLRGYAQLDIAHKGNMWNDLRAENSNGFPRILQPGYTVMNLRMGLNKADSAWMAELYISNLLNKNAIIYTNTGNFDLRQTVNEPRVFGLRLNYRWGKRGGGEE
jgi:outer membrane receptor protein involved in Fe transport